MPTDSLSTELRTVSAGTRLEIAETGQGLPILFLHPGIGLRGAEPFLTALGRIGHVIAPAHPGFQGSPAANFASVDDLSYLYLSLLDDLDEPALVVGSSLGGWIALETAVKSTAKIAGLVLVDSVGVRFSTREIPDVADIYALSREELDKRMYHDPSVARIDYPSTPIPELETIARNREAETRFSWSPYLHNPRLTARLYRVDVPTMVIWGESDTFAPVGYGRQLAKALPNASFEIIGKAGHFPHIEQATDLASRIERFAVSLKSKTGAGKKMGVAR
jgi:pimeloyl-ACP methyl ester carboxylesterase